MEHDILNRIEIRKGDITRLDVEAIVNAANTSLLGGGGVDGAIHRAAGPELLEACRKIGGCPTGEARLTKGFNLPADYVIHTVGPVYKSQRESAPLLTKCYVNSLETAVEHNIASIAFPAISCGVYGYPINDACKIAVDTTCGFISRHPSITKIIFMLFSSQDFNVYQNYLIIDKRAFSD